MKYVAYWLGTMAVLTIIAVVGYAGALLVSAVQRDPSLVWVPLAIVVIVALSTLVAVVEYLTDKRPVSGEIIE